ncbi:uncharacterized protein L969DRAFT_84529 [Mixia osmundae IAM 14324]|uniref:PH domain-containing protein n=1 Tax=Mixia osmundae (strain CBS 9802 / IAM 14324 / JCM 22182 / KY 12970) TaxID=764103 RepID=G7E574_MIXOS|nr:uncharacterized protein L969DRAFT_84529 [Mixia osmundae IAM 14324]KEI42659.1 hypothetical protein L969DRAFT_84529 [Mixia osmundae IAM 14324]GAA97984.1 hypothetical protein E5Q_04664 [Mixia osmundae IAM 14324]
MFGRSSDIVLEGYLDKKKQKQYQGFAKRYFWLDNKGVLSYAVNPNSRVRASLFVGLASIVRSSKNKTITIDSGSTIFHCRALSDQDFEKWTKALRRFIGTADDKQGGAAVGEVGSGVDSSKVDLSAIFDTVAKMSLPINEVGDIARQLQSDDLKSSTSGSDTASSNKITQIFKKGHKDHKQNGGANTHELGKQLSQASATLKNQHTTLVNTINAAGPSFPSSGGGKAAYGSRTAIGFDKVKSNGNDSDADSDATYGTAQGAEFDLDDIDDDGAQSDYEAAADDDDDSGSDAEHAGKDEAEHGDADDGVKRRKQLPAPVSGDEFSMFSMLKKNMGKDLSKISFPVSFNEPLSAVQRLAEEMEYTSLIKKAISADDSIERLCYITAFAISQFAGLRYRSSRKPFNPLVGETYELVRKDKDLRFIGEKVSHHPPIMACAADGEKWHYFAHSGGKQKFWGRSLEYIPEGHTELKFKDSEDVFTWNKPSTFVKNIMSGEKYLEISGEMTVKNEHTGEKAVVQFKEGSSWGGADSRNKFDGKIHDKSGKTITEVTGKWSENVTQKTGKDSYKELWKAADWPKDATKYYGFSTFAVQLNEVTDDIKKSLAPTDSRLRPDQRAMEDGDVDKAEETKKTLEDKQREKRKEWESSNSGPQPPQYFEEKDGKWHAKEGESSYWEKRENGKWEDLKIFEA